MRIYTNRKTNLRELFNALINMPFEKPPTPEMKPEEEKPKEEEEIKEREKKGLEEKKPETEALPEELPTREEETVPEKEITPEIQEKAEKFDKELSQGIGGALKDEMLTPEQVNQILDWDKEAINFFFGSNLIFLSGFLSLTKIFLLLLLSP